MTEILICGYTELFTEEALLQLSEDYRVVLTGKTSLNSRNKRKNIVIYKTSPTEEKFHQLFDVYSFQTVFYVSGYADGGKGMFGENQQLEQVMRECRNSRTDKLVVISTTDSSNYIVEQGRAGEGVKKDYYGNRAFGAGQMEDACMYYAERLRIKTVLLKLPYIADRINDCNFLGEVFRALYNKDKVLFPYHREDPVDFLSMSDVAELMTQLTEETEDESGNYCVVSGYRYTYGDLEDMLKLAVPDARIGYENYPYMAGLPDYSAELRERYGFIPMDNVMENIASYYRVFVREVVKDDSGLPGKLRRVLAGTGKEALKYTELILVFIIAEIVSGYTSDSIYFRFVDVRLFYILIMGTIHGTGTGLLAAVLECVMLFRGYMQMGMTGTILFYNIENWIPFAVYLMTGSITGYISTKKEEAIDFAKREYGLLRDKYLFLNDVYHGAIENKGEYRKQILGFKDSFGRIFDAVQKLDSELPDRVFFDGIKVLEEILENHSIAIYRLDSWQRFGRLAVCSNSLLTGLTKSIKIEDYQTVYDTVRRKQVWKNTEMLPDLPMYACGIFRGEEIVLLVMIWKADADQYSMHYMNIFQIMCGLMQTSFLRAIEHEELAESRIYYKDTNIVYPERLRRLFEVQEAMKQEGVADYVLVRFAEKDKREISEKLTGMIRASDVLGADEQGNLYLLLVQMNRKNFNIVGDRLSKRGVEYQIVEDIA